MITSYQLANYRWVALEWWEDLEWPRLFSFLAFWPVLTVTLTLQIIIVLPALVLLAWENNK